MQKLFITATVLATLLGPSTSFATGGLGCMIEDENLDFVFETIFSYSDETKFLQSKMEFKPKYAGLPPSLLSLDENSTKVVQQWMGHESINLQFAANSTEANAKFTKLTLSIETKQQEDETSYEGKYVLEIQPAPVNGALDAPIAIKGKASCSAG